MQENEDRLKVKSIKPLKINPPYSYGTSAAICDHTELPATRHKSTLPALTPASKPVLDLPTHGYYSQYILVVDL